MILYATILLLVIICLWQYKTNSDQSAELNRLNKREALWANIRKYVIAFNSAWYARNPINQGKSEVADFSPNEKENLRQLWTNIANSGTLLDFDERKLQSDGYFPMVSYR